MAEDTFFLTKQGKARLERELKDLLRLRLAKTQGDSPQILHSEDINPEFLAYQEDLELLQGRINEVENILKHVQIIAPPPKKEQGKVGLGALVKVEIDGQTDEFVIVGTLEANPDIGRISTESPIGRALLGHRKGDKIIVSSPTPVTYKIVGIRYSS